MDPIAAKALLQKYLEGDASPEEIILIEQWYQQQAEAGAFEWDSGEKESRAAAIERRLLAQMGGGRRVVMRWRMVGVAAVVLLVVAGAYLLLVRKSSRAVVPVAERYHNDVNPGRNAAVLTLAGGKTVLLNDSTPRVIGRQGDALVTHGSGSLVYEAGGGKEMVYNTLTTQKGNQYHLTLPDGTKVWLNAASSISYPSVFGGKQRNVSVSGEVYFEVAKNEQQPFVVRQGNIDIEVLGTSFDVNGYGDEGGVRTTLLEGKVRAGGSVLSPGQQAVVGKGGGVSVVDGADVDAVMAWKNGNFAFKDAGIEAIMQQIARWYDVEVVYETKIRTHFVADIPRDVPLSQLLKLLEETDQVHFRIEGRKVIVTP
jgi:ferric-dicitrate binding protein FerR (iron transport regulator)